MQKTIDGILIIMGTLVFSMVALILAHSYFSHEPCKELEQESNCNYELCRYEEWGSDWNKELLLDCSIISNMIDVQITRGK